MQMVTALNLSPRINQLPDILSVVLSVTIDERVLLLIVFVTAALAHSLRVEILRIGTVPEVRVCMRNINKDPSPSWLIGHLRPLVTASYPNSSIINPVI